MNKNEEEIYIDIQNNFEKNNYEYVEKYYIEPMGYINAILMNLKFHNTIIYESTLCDLRYNIFQKMETKNNL